MFGIGFGEMVVIVILMLIAVGPDKLPMMVKTVAKTYRQFRRAATDIRASTGIDDFLRDEELKELAELRKQKLSLLASQPTAIAGKPGAPGKPQGTVGKGAGPIGKTGGARAMHAPVDGAPVPAAPIKGFAVAPGLTLEQRLAEAPSEGVDIAEARHALAPTAASIPATRTDRPAIEEA